MKTTLDLPDELVQRLKIRAVMERRPLKHFVAELLAKGLEPPVEPAVSREKPLPTGLELNEHGFPVFRCRADAPASRMTAEELIAMEQQALEEEEDLSRVGIAP
ncbi:MAG: hypothetical protein ACKV19_14050 [Verrucomicrobiales bacterium]